jgi:hypothetical protein
MSYISIRENRRSNHEWTIQRHWEHWAHEDKQTKAKIHNTGNLKDKQHGSHQTTRGEIKCLLMVSSACYLCLFDIEGQLSIYIL